MKMMRHLRLFFSPSRERTVDDGYPVERAVQPCNNTTDPTSAERCGG